MQCASLQRVQHLLGSPSAQRCSAHTQSKVSNSRTPSGTSRPVCRNHTKNSLTCPRRAATPAHARRPLPSRAAWRRESGSQRVGRPRPLHLLEALPSLLMSRGVIGGVLARPTAPGELADARRENFSSCHQVYVTQLQRARPTPRDAAETCLRVEETQEARAVELRLPARTMLFMGCRHGTDTKGSHSSQSVGNPCQRPLARGAPSTCRTSPPRADW